MYEEINWAFLAFEILIIVALAGGNIKRMGNTYLLGFIIHIVLLVYQSNTGALPMCGGDMWIFHGHAVELLNSANGSLLYILFENESGIDLYERIVAIVYYFASVRSIYMYYFSAICAEIVSHYVYNAAYAISKNPSIASKAALLFYFWPLEMVYSVDYLREMLIQACVAYILYNLILWIYRKNIVCYVKALIVAFFTMMIHSGMVGVILALVFILFMYNKRRKEIVFNPVMLLPIALTLVLIVASPLWNVIAGRFTGMENLADVTNKMMGNNVLANTDYISSPSSGIGILLQTPLRLFYFMFAPMPWHIRSGGILIAFFADTVFRVIAWKKIIETFKMRDNLLPEEKTILLAGLMIILISDLIFSWGTNNFGTAMRHRLKVFPAEIILMCVLNQLAKRRKYAEQI